MKPAPIILGALVALVVVSLNSRRALANVEAPALWTETAMGWVDNLTTWQGQRENEKLLRPEIENAERAFGLPAGLLSRVLYQESRFRTDIINGTTRSSAGALGIAQFMPATAAEFKIDPLDPYQAIPAAAKYLRQLHDNFGAWPLALAAYNFGWGNVSRGRAWPAETVAYVREITSDVGLV